jgi:transcription antitermination factor NusG
MTQRRWFVVQTRIQSETKAAASLRARGYRVYEPYMRKTVVFRKVTGKVVVKRFRLFARYLFVSLPYDFEPHIGAVRGCKGVDDILGMDLDGKACEISRSVVRRFMLAQRKGEFDDVVPITRTQMQAKIPLGSKVRVSGHGVFGGFYGQVRSIKGRGVIIAGIEMFGRLVPVQLGAGDYTIVKAEAA